MPEHPISLSDIETCLQFRRRRLTFEPVVETAYEEQTRVRRAYALRRTIAQSLFAYNSLILIDYLVLPGTFAWALLLHALVTIAGIGVVFAIKVRPPRLLRELLAASTPLLMFAQVMAIYLMNRGDAADHYQYFALVVIILINTCHRIDLQISIVVAAALAGSYTGLLWLASYSTWPAKVVGTALMTTIILTTLAVCRRMERDARYAFLKRTQDKLKRDAVEAFANRDDLTGLFNRRYLDERILALWAASQGDESVALLMIDVDFFKKFNDRYGHLAGDVCLTRVASAIAAQLSNKDDIAVRFGGEEFLVLLVDKDLMTAVRIAERIRCAIEALDIPHEASVCGVVTASLGVMAGPIGAHRASDLIASADTALYAAKRAGRNRVWPPFVKADSSFPSSKGVQLRAAVSIQ